MKENVFADAVHELRKVLLSDPTTRQAIIKWAITQHGSSAQESERTSMLQEMFGDDFAGR